MNAGVSSRGSPIPKSMISTPAARSRARGLARAARTGTCRARPARGRGGLTCRSASSTWYAAQQRGDLDLLVAPVRLRGRARAEVDRRIAGRRRTRRPASTPAWARRAATRPGSACAPAGGRARPAPEPARCGRRPASPCPPRQLAQPRLGLRRRPPRRVAEVHVRRARSGITFIAIPPATRVTDATSRNVRPSKRHRRTGGRGQRRDPDRRAVDRVVGVPRPRGVARAARGTSTSR